MVAIHLMEFTPSVLVGPHLSIGLRWYLQSCRYVGDGDQLLELHPSRACPPRGPFVGFLPPLLLCCCLVDSHRLGSGGCPGSDGGQEALLLCYAIVCRDMC